MTNANSPLPYADDIEDFCTPDDTPPVPTARHSAAFPPVVQVRQVW